MPAEFYRIMHFVGIMLTFLAFGGACLHGMNGGTKEDNKGRKWIAISHGVGLLLVLVAGFGLLAKGGFSFAGSPWVWVKLVVWLAFGGLMVPIQRKPQLAKAMWYVVPALGLLAAIMAVLKPF